MDAYYSNQIQLPYFAGAARQRGSGLGALALSIGRFALPIFKNVLYPAAKRFGKELLSESVPVLADVAAGKTTLRKGAKRTLKGAAIKSLQRGSGGMMSKKQDQQPLLSNESPKKKKKKAPTSHKSQRKVKRSRYEILKNLEE